MVTAATSRPERAARSDRAATKVAPWQEWVAAWIGRIVTIAAVWSLVSIPLRGRRWTDFVDDVFGWFNIPAGSSLFVIVLMFLMGSALRRRLRVAIWTVIIFQLVSMVLELVVVGFAVANWHAIPTDNLDINRPEAVMVGGLAVLSAALAAFAWKVRPAFPARLARGARVASLAVLIIGLLGSAVVTFALTEAFPHDLTGATERILWAIRSTLGVTTRADTPGFHGHSGHHWIASLAGLMSALALLAAAGVFLRSARAGQFLAAQDEYTVRRLILEGGERDSLAYFATRRDKSVIFSPDGRAAITYRVVASVSLASADPVGHVGSWPAAIEAWLAEARGHGWFPAVLSASEQGAAAYVEAGLKALAIGDEAIVDPEGFTLEGRTMRPVRQAVTRVHRAGYTVQARRHADISAAELTELGVLAEQWRGDETERGFSMALSRLGDPADGRCVMVTAHDASGSVRGLLSFVPWGARGLSLDLMRRDRTAENGLTEFMVNGLVEASADLGVRRISLNFAMFRSVFSAAERVGAGPVLRLTEAVLSLASRFWQLETLYRSNAKYLPSWVPRFLCYDSSLTLTRAAIASGMAEGFIPSPKPVCRQGSELVLTESGVQLDFSEAVIAQEDRLLRPPRPARYLGEQQRIRRLKIDRLAAAGMSAYPAQVPRSTTAAEVEGCYRNLGRDERTDDRVSIAGRVRALRDLGGVTFAVLHDDGIALQVMLTRSDTPDAIRRLWHHTVDLGDQVSVTGRVVTSRTGELSVLVDDWAMAAKCLRPLPDLYSGLSDPDARIRQRYLDLIVNRESMGVLHARSRAVQSLRESFARRGYTEVETPMLHTIHGGAAARPFRTHINAYDTDLYLRIAPELFLKRLCIGGMGRIFELNRNFRNEGADGTHNPEFTSVEAYQAYADYNDMRELTRELVVEVATSVHGRPIARRMSAAGTPYDVDLTGDWPVVSVHDAVSKATGTPIMSATPLDIVRGVCSEFGVHSPLDATAGDLVLRLYDELVEKQTVEPTFFCDFPIETSPLTRTHRTDPALSERWDLVAFGTEIGTAYSELIDPVDQRQRLTDQSMRAAAGDPEAMQLDESFLTAMEYAMPPTGGLGIGVDRLVMMLTGTNIRATLAFPFVRPHSAG